MANIYLGLPVFRHQTGANCSAGNMRLISHFHALGVSFTWRMLAQNGIDISRNHMAAEFIANKQFTHLLFIDDDMDFEPNLIERLIAAQKPLIGAVCTTRELNLETFFIEAKKSTYRKALAKASTFCVENPIELKSNGFCTVGAIGMGVTLIAREVFTKISATSQVDKYNPDSRSPDFIKAPYYGFFDCLVENGVRLSEDYSFCKRWRELCQGEIWGITDGNVGHEGSFIYRANVEDLLDAT